MLNTFSEITATERAARNARGGRKPPPKNTAETFDWDHALMALADTFVALGYREPWTPLPART